MKNINLKIPNDFEAEQAVLGSMIYDNNTHSLIRSIMKSPSYFYERSHQYIFRAMLELIDSNQPVDELLLGDQLKSLNELEDIGGYSYLASLVDCVPNLENVASYCKIIAEHYYLRQFISITNDISKKARIPGSKTNDLIDEAIENLSKLRGKLASNAKAVSVFDAMPEVINKIESVSQGKIEIGFISGYDDFDRMLGGAIQKGDLIFIGAEASVGKTSLAVCLGYSLILRSKKGIIFSIESSTESIIRDRLLPASLSINSHLLRSGVMGQSQWDDIHELANQDFLKDLKICDESTMNINDIYSMIAMEQKTNGIDFAMIDYAQLITPVVNTGNRNNDLGAIARGMIKICKDFDIPLVALSQLTDEKLRDSGELEHAADVVILLKPKEDGIINAFFKKNRNGKKGDCLLQFIPEYTKFKSVE
jgi:replicative DNA helicase